MRISNLIYLIICILFSSCNDLYKAGNLVALDYPVNTKIRTRIVQQYIDTLIECKGFRPPQKWQKFDKLFDLDSINHKRIYFSRNPEEMYLISYGGALVINDIYNPKLNGDDWVSDRSSLSPEDVERISERFKKEILDAVEQLAKRDGLPDSAIYK